VNRIFFNCYLFVNRRKGEGLLPLNNQLTIT
jgi:hypothetical protein